MHRGAHHHRGPRIMGRGWDPTGVHGPRSIIGRAHDGSVATSIMHRWVMRVWVHRLAMKALRGHLHMMLALSTCRHAHRSSSSRHRSRMALHHHRHHHITITVIHGRRGAMGAGRQVGNRRSSASSTGRRASTKLDLAIGLARDTGGAGGGRGSLGSRCSRGQVGGSHGTEGGNGGAGGRGTGELATRKLDYSLFIFI